MAGINRTTGKATDLITFSRASRGTALRKISYGSELVVNGDGSSTDGWDFGGTQGFTSDGSVFSVVRNGNSTWANYPNQTILTVGKTYLISVDIIAVRNNVTISTDGASVEASTTSTGTFQVVLTAASTTFYILAAGDSLATATIDNVSVKEVLFDQPDGTLTLFNHPNNIPRIEYAADGTVKGLLIEEQRTNLLTYSEDLTQTYWIKTEVTVDANTITEKATTNIHRFFNTPVTVGAGATVSAQVKLKKNAGHDYAYVGIGGNTGRRAYVIVNLTNGQITESGVEQAATGATLIGQSVSPLGAGEYLVSVTGSIATSETDAALIVGISNSATPGGLPSYLGNVANSIDATAMQLEAGSFPTSYIPTSGATATRAADIASISVDSFGYRQDAGTVVVEADTFSTAVNNHQDFNLVATSAPSVNSIHSGSRVGGGVAGQYTLWVQSGGSTVALISKTSVISDNTVYKAAWTASENDFALTVDGQSVVTDTSGAMPSAATEARIGYGTYGRINGHIKSVTYYPRRLSNAQLVQLTA